MRSSGTGVETPDALDIKVQNALIWQISWLEREYPRLRFDVGPAINSLVRQCRHRGFTGDWSAHGFRTSSINLAVTTGQQACMHNIHMVSNMIIIQWYPHLSRVFHFFWSSYSSCIYFVKIIMTLSSWIDWTSAFFSNLNLSNCNSFDKFVIFNALIRPKLDTKAQNWKL